jgi:hypothetical protein
MRRRLFVFAVVAALATFALLSVSACKRAGSARLEGRWKGTKAEGVTPDLQARANDFASHMELDVAGDTITVKTSADTQSGKFKVLEETKTAVIIATDKDAPSDRQTFTFENDKTMKWSVMDGKTITFAKQ